MQRRADGSTSPPAAAGIVALLPCLKFEPLLSCDATRYGPESSLAAAGFLMPANGGRRSVDDRRLDGALCSSRSVLVGAEPYLVAVVVSAF